MSVIINAADDTKGYFTLVESPSAAQRGTQSVLIGLLLPAVQLSAARQMGDGSVRLAR